MAEKVRKADAHLRGTKSDMYDDACSHICSFSRNLARGDKQATKKVSMEVDKLIYYVHRSSTSSQGSGTNELSCTVPYHLQPYNTRNRPTWYMLYTRKRPKEG